MNNNTNNLSTLEKKFLAAKTEAEKKIFEKLDAADKLINEAIKISEQYGIPFESQVSQLSQTYTPESFEQKFGELSRDWLCEVADFYPGEDAGWDHSAVCW